MLPFARRAIAKKRFERTRPTMLVCCRLSISFFTFANTVALVIGSHMFKRYFFLAVFRFARNQGKGIGLRIVDVRTRFLLDIIALALRYPESVL